MSGHSTPSARSRQSDLTGRQFGKIVVVRVDGRDRWGKRRWLCRCECGTEKTFAHSSLRPNSSCGCNSSQSRAGRLRVMARKAEDYRAKNILPDGTVTLTNGLVAHVDPEDVTLISGYVWRSQQDRRTHYARAVIPGTRVRKIFMHVLLMGKREGFEVDHADGNGLNNRRSNLRWATNGQNAANLHTKKTGCTSRFRGVFKWAKSPGWGAQVRKDGKTYYLGTFAVEEDAARAYDAKAKELHGEFASLNFPG